MHRLIPALILLVLAGSLGCTYEPQIIEGWEDGVDCTNNSNPKMGQWFLSSAPVLNADGSPSATEWFIGSHFAWRDPDPPENEDPQNMVGGWISMEIENLESSIPYITSEWLHEGCPPGQEASCATLGFPSNQTGCSGSGCRDGSLTMPLVIIDGCNSEGCSFHVAVRVRDRCGAASNERDTYGKGRYTIGSGIVEVTATDAPADDGGG